jgi:hypothetical protein
MKAGFVLWIFLFYFGGARAQRFFYVESGSVAEKPLKESLLKFSQYIARTPIMSDYLIKTELGIQPGFNKASISITIEDSATFNPVFQTTEEYAFPTMMMNYQRFLHMAVETMIEKNITQMIISTNNAHREGMVNQLKMKKDKT